VLILRKILAFALAFILANQQFAFACFSIQALWLVPHKAGADAFADSAASGQALGTGMVNAYTPPLVDQDSGMITLRNGSANGQTLEQSGLYPQAVPGSMDAAHNAYGDASAMTGVTANAEVSLSRSNGNSYQYAYQTLMGAHHATVDMSNDPIWKVSNATFNGSNGLMDSMVSGCDTNSSTTSSTGSVHMPDYKTCHKSAAPQGCTVTRLVEVQPDDITQVSSSGQAVFADTQLSTDITLGVNKAGSFPNFGCASHEDQIVINVTDADAIDSATLAAAGADDGLTLSIDGNQAWAPFADCGDYAPWHNDALNIDLTSRLKSNGTHTLRLAASTSADTKMPYAYAILKIKKTPGFKDSFAESPPGCRANIFNQWDQITGGQSPPWFPTGSPGDRASTQFWQCLDAGDARVIGGVTFDATAYGPRMAPILPDPPASPPAPICHKAAIRVPTSGTMQCWTDSGGLQHCPTVPVSAQDTCADYEGNPSCGYVGQECVKGATDPSSGQCNGWVLTYDCGAEQQVIGGSGITSSTICGGQLRCMGTECIRHAVEANPDFGRAAGAMSVLQGAQMDNSCPEGDTANCKIFVGKNQTCKSALGGYVDCCSQPDAGVTVVDHVEMAYATWNMADKTGLLDSLTQGQGVWAGLQNAGIGAYNSVMGAVTSNFENVASVSGTPFSFAGSVLATETGQAVSVAVTQWAVDLFGRDAVLSVINFTSSSAGSGAAQTVTVEAVQGLSQLAGNVLTGVGIAMAVYQIATMVIQMVYACTPDELKLGVDRQLRQCHYAGAFCAQKVLGMCLEEKDSYCCFGSPLGRIIQEQARLQAVLGRPWGEPEKPDCGGLAVDDMERIDWPQVDLSEWVGILTAAHKLPSSSSDAQSMYSKATATSSPFPVASKPDVNDRVKTQFQNQTVEQARQKLQQQLQ
jgi:conjugal transfer mating pair stabilization protein TraN